MGVVTAAVAGAGLAGGASLLASKMGSDAQSSAAKKQAGLLQEGVNKIEDVDVPTIDSQLIKLQQLKLSGQLTPEQETAIDQKISNLKSIVTDPALKDAQMAALSKLKQIGDEGGLTATDKAQLNEVLTSTNRQGQSNRNAILQNAAQRGMSGSGLEQAAELTSQQNDATNASNEGFKTAAMAQQRALDAISQAGTLGGQIQAQDFGQKAQIASAQDSIDRFNAANQQSVGNANVAANNSAQAANLARSDQQSLYNTDIANQQEKANKALVQQNYLNSMNKAQAEANAYAGQGTAAINAGNAAANIDNAVGGAVGGALGQVGTSIADYQAGKEKQANDLEIAKAKAGK